MFWLRNKKINFSVHTLQLKACGTCSKISNTFLVLFLNKMLVIRARIHKMHAGIANRVDPDQGLLSALFV